MIFEKISELCRRKEITISALETELGFGNGTIKAWKRSTPTISKLKAVADYFGVKIDDLI